MSQKTEPRNPNPYTGAVFRGEFPGVKDGTVCPSCEDPDSVYATRDGVCYLCVCGCSYCEPD